MIPLVIEYVILVMLTVHFISDFIMQSDHQAKQKSVSISALTEHAFEYSLFMMFGFIGISGAFGHDTPIIALYATGITLVAHWVTDYFTSRLNKRLWESGNTHNFFVGIGFDQLLHAIQIILTIKFLYYV